MTWVKATGEHKLTFHGADGSTLIVQLADPIKHRTDSASIAARDLTLYNPSQIYCESETQLPDGNLCGIINFFFPMCDDGIRWLQHFNVSDKADAIKVAESINRILATYRVDGPKLLSETEFE